MNGRPSSKSGAVRTERQIAKDSGIPRSTVHRDLERARDVLALEIVFAVLPPKVQQRWLRNKLAAV